jgi:high-affinity nickel permease
VGILFGFGRLLYSDHWSLMTGFDTASSIALLAISAVAQRGATGESISHGKIVILPVSASVRWSCKGRH